VINGVATCNAMKVRPPRNTEKKNQARSAVKVYDWEGHQHMCIQTRTQAQNGLFVRSTARSISVRKSDCLPGNWKFNKTHI